MILKKKVTTADLESVDAELHRGMTWMLWVYFVTLTYLPDHRIIARMISRMSSMRRLLL